MWAYVKNSQLVRLYARPTAITIGGLQYPSTIMSSWSASQLKEIGIYSYSETGAKDSQYYDNGSVAYTVNDSEGTVVGKYSPKAKDLAATKSSQVKLINTEANSRLSGSDWMAIRKGDDGTAIPSDWNTYRANVRGKSDSMVTAINNASDIDALADLYKNTYHANGSINVMGACSPLQWPTSPEEA